MLRRLLSYISSPMQVFACPHTRLSIYAAIFITICCTIFQQNGYAQNRDSVYTEDYSQKMWSTVYTAINTMQLRDNDLVYSPNYPLSMGVGLGIRNTALNIQFGHSLLPLRGDKYGKSKTVDFQLHRYDRFYVLDLYYQNYRGFYSTDKKEVTLHPDIAVKQIGGDFTYLFNGRNFSVKAAFEKSRIQVRSAGSWLLGTGLFYQQYHVQLQQADDSEASLDGLQASLSAGYAYSWVFNSPWQITAMATAGFSAGNAIDNLKLSELKVYPTALARAAATYQFKASSLSFSMRINNRKLHIADTRGYDLLNLNMQLSFVKQLNSFFR